MSTRRMFDTEESEIFGANVQNWVVQGLYTPAVLICLEWCSKWTAIIPAQIPK
jgi:hypothetical protein